MIKIRKAHSGDILQMVKVLQDAYHKNYSAAGEFYARQELVDPNYETTSGPFYSTKMFVAENVKSMRRRLKKPFKAFVMLDKNSIIGYIIIEDHLGRTWINDMVIKKDYQNRCLGKKLFRHATKGKNKVYLWVNTKNPALRFWKKQGFKELLRECLMIKD
ncbi:MAG: GNAT family N-acetyltransferase [Candidatus Aenigmatarchaeota archaeon]